jgi:hypothetical protein
VTLDVAHETAVVDAFVVSSKRDRVRELLAKPKRRRTILDSLNHQAPLDPRCMSKIPPREHFTIRIESLLRAKGAPEMCHVISADPTLDGKAMPLRAALDDVIGCGNGTIISCIPGRLAYFEGEDPGERYLLEQPPTPAKT